MKGHVTFHDDEESKQTHYSMLAKKMFGDDSTGADGLVAKLTSPLRTVLEITPAKWITFDMEKMQKDQVGLLEKSERGELLSSDSERLQAEVARRGLTLESD